MADELIYGSARQLADAVATGQVSAVELAEAAITGSSATIR